jgi:hypothetical protein
MQCDPAPGEPLHVGHRRIVVEVGEVPTVLLQIVKLPVGVECPRLPVETVVTPISLPARNT